MGGTIHPAYKHNSMHHNYYYPRRPQVCVFLFFSYPLFFLYFTASELGKNQRSIIYNKSLGRYADKEGCADIKASQPKPIPIPFVGNLLAKVNLNLSYNINAVSPIMWAKNLKGEYISDKTSKKQWVEGLGVLLEGRVRPADLPASDNERTEVEEGGAMHGGMLSRKTSAGMELLSKMKMMKKCQLHEILIWVP